VRATSLFAAATSIAISLPCAAEIPTRSHRYSNADYQFSVDIPNHLQGCVSKDTNDGVEIPLDYSTGCAVVTTRPPFATVFANYNVATGVNTLEGLATLTGCGKKPRMWQDIGVQ
jgi:hypothetical protein